MAAPGNVDEELAALMGTLQINDINFDPAGGQRPPGGQGPFLRYLGHLLDHLHRACHVIIQMMPFR